MQVLNLTKIAKFELIVLVIRTQPKVFTFRFPTVGRIPTHKGDWNSCYMKHIHVHVNSFYKPTVC